MLGERILCFEEIDSTNSEIRRQAENGEDEGLAAVAEYQTGGRGRRGREWFSPAGTGIWMSILLRPQLAPEKVSGITLMAALSVCRVLRSVTGLNAEIKWPNDIVIDGKKICGILTEAAMNGNRLDYVVLGIGVNVNQTEFPRELPYASSLAMEMGKMLDREKLLNCMLERLTEDYEVYLQSGDLRDLRAEYESHLTNLKNDVRVLASQGEWCGAAEGISESGDLLVRDREGHLHVVNSGEVSVRGVYGYS